MGVGESKTINPRTGISKRDIELIRKGWGKIAEHGKIKKNSVEFFYQLFTAHPELQNYFESLQNVKTEDIRGSAVVRAHSVVVFFMISSYVDNLHDPPTLLALMEKLVRSHVRKGLRSEQFEILASVFPSYLRSRLGAKYVTMEMEQSWLRLLALQTSIFKDIERDLGRVPTDMVDV